MGCDKQVCFPFSQSEFFVMNERYQREVMGSFENA